MTPEDLQRALGLPVGVTPGGWCSGPCRVCDDIPVFVALAYGAVVLMDRPAASGQATLQDAVVGP